MCQNEKKKHKKKIQRERERESADSAQVEAFYQYWFNFKSWRDFSFEDEYDPEQAESREERRWMERQNERRRQVRVPAPLHVLLVVPCHVQEMLTIAQKLKREEHQRIMNIVQIANRRDPRVIKHNEEIKLARKREKQERYEALRKQKEEKVAVEFC